MRTSPPTLEHGAPTALDTPARPLIAAPAIAFRHVSLAFDDAVILHDVTFDVADGEMATLLGPSGSGKSLILRLALGLLPPDAGSIEIYGQPIERLDDAALVRVRDQIGMLFQESALFDSLTVEENVGFKLQDRRRLDAHAIRARVDDVLRFVGLDGLGDRLPAHLSGGQRRRVAIARAIAGGPRLLLLDDPTVGLDPITAKTVIAEVIKLRDLQHVSVLAVTHQLQDAFFIATHEALLHGTEVRIRRRESRVAGQAHFIVLRDGAISFDGTARGLMQSDDPWVVASRAGWVPPLTLDERADGLVRDQPSRQLKAPAAV